MGPFDAITCSKINSTRINLNHDAVSDLNLDELSAIKDALSAFGEDMSDSDSGCLKKHFRLLWWLFVALYAITGLTGALGNIYMMAVMSTQTNFRRFLNFLLFSLCLSDLLKCLFVLPFSLIVLLSQHWRLGAFLCRASPLLQTYPIVISMATYLLIGVDRYLTICRPPTNSYSLPIEESRRRVVFLVFTVAAWAASFCLVLPLKHGVRYYDLSDYFGDELSGYGICAIGYDVNTKEINCGVFIVLYAIPLAVITYLMIKCDNELCLRIKRDTRAFGETIANSNSVRSTPAVRRENNRSSIRSNYLSATNNRPVADQDDQEQRRFLSPSVSANRSLSAVENQDGSSGGVSPKQPAVRTRSFLAYIEHDQQQQDLGQLTLLLRLNRCLSIMLALFAIFWAPLQLLMLVCYVVQETPEAASTVDILFAVCTLLGLSSAITNPALLIYQQKSVHAVLHSGLRVVRRLSSAAAGSGSGLIAAIRRTESSNIKDNSG